MPRLFIAIDLPEQQRRLLAELRDDLAGVRWVRPEQLHLTLAFLGEVPQEMLAPLRQLLAQIRSVPFQLELGRLGCFPPRGIPRVLWIGVQPQPLLLQLERAVNSAVVSCGLTLEARPFSPHITLARRKEPDRRAVSVFLTNRAPEDLPPIPVQEFLLFESRLTPHGALHQVLQRYPLDPQTPAA